MNEEKNAKQIDLAKTARQLWAHRKTYYKVLPATLVITYLIIVCVPRYYRCQVSLAPEISGPSMSGSLSSLASSFGLGGTLAKMSGQDAIYAEIYPKVIGSKDFIADLMTVEVATQDSLHRCSYYQYLRDHQKAAWWDVVMTKVKNLFVSADKDAYAGEEKLSVMHLTKRQDDLFSSVKGKVKCVVDKKTDMVTITVEDQDPLVSATMANATCEKLQSFITSYRTNKARIDYEYYQKLCQDSRAAYEKAIKDYSRFADSNRDAVLSSYRTKEESLENDMQAKYSIYTAMNTQLQAAAAKLQEATPAFTVVESASVPVKPAGPKRMLLSIFFTILSFFVLSGKILMQQAKGKQSEQ